MPYVFQSKDIAQLRDKLPNLQTPETDEEMQDEDPYEDDSDGLAHILPPVLTTILSMNWCRYGRLSGL